MRLEKKIKTSGLCGKRSARSPPGRCSSCWQAISAFCWKARQPADRVVQQDAGAAAGPRRIVTYDREAFLWAPGNLRITLDRNLRAGWTSVPFFRPGAAPYPHGPRSDGAGGQIRRFSAGAGAAGGAAAPRAGRAFSNMPSAAGTTEEEPCLSIFRYLQIRVSGGSERRPTADMALALGLPLRWGCSSSISISVAMRGCCTPPALG